MKSNPFVCMLVFVVILSVVMITASGVDRAYHDRRTSRDEKVQKEFDERQAEISAKLEEIKAGLTQIDANLEEARKNIEIMKRGR